MNSQNPQTNQERGPKSRHSPRAETFCSREDSPVLGKGEPVPEASETSPGTGQPFPKSPKPTLQTDQEETTEEEIKKAIGVVRAENKGNVTLVAKTLKIRQARAVAIMVELEKRGVVGPAKKGAPREVLPIAPPNPNITVLPAREQPIKKPVVLQGQAALQAFYERLTFSPADEEKTWLKRGLSSKTQADLGYRSNPRSNQEILLQLGNEFSHEDLFAAGLWQRADGKKPARPNSQFHGFGISGKREKDDPERAKSGKFKWSWCEPILIPYRDEDGRIIGLRPHKGMAPGDTLCGRPKIYVPRRAEAHGGREYSVVVITEGEFKAAALWQVLGDGAENLDGLPPIGVVAIPGITFASHFEIRQELDDWLRRVKCHTVKVAFDFEIKPPDAPGRFDSQIWSRYLACDLHRKLHIRAEVVCLPMKYADENGKVDWDGVLAKITHRK